MHQATLGSLFTCFRRAAACGVEQLGNTQTIIGDGLRCAGEHIRPGTPSATPTFHEDRYVANVTGLDFISLAALQEEKAHVKNVQLVQTQDQLQQASKRYYIIGYGGVGCAFGLLGLSLGCLVTFPWQILGACLLLACPKVFSEAFCQYDSLMQERDRWQKRSQELLGVVSELEERIVQVQDFQKQNEKAANIA